MNYNNINIEWNKVDEVISAAKKIFLTTHENPDGDGLGSEVALYHHLIEIGKEVKIINCSPTPEIYDFLNLDNCIETFKQSSHLEWIKNADLAIVFDVGDFKRVREIKSLIKGYESIKKISSREKNAINVLCRGAALRYLLTRLYDYSSTPKTALIKIKNPNEYYQKLLTHNSLNSYKDYLPR